MKSVIITLLCITPFLSFAQNVGVNDDGTAPYAGAILDVNSSDKGILIPRLETSAVANPAEGMLVYQPSDQSFYFYKGSAWEKINAGTSTGGSFETTAQNLIRSTGSNVDNEDLLIGRTSVPGFSNITDKFFHYDQSSGAFRGGKLDNSNAWSPINVGANSFAYGENVKADGPSSIALGQEIEINSSSTGFAIGLRDTVTGNLGSGAFGYENNVAGSKGNIAIGSNNEIDGDSNLGAVAIGYNSRVLADSGAVAIGKNISSFIDGAVVVGRNNSLVYPSDLAFAVGNASSPYDTLNPRADGLVVRGNGYIGINDNFPDDMMVIKNKRNIPKEGLTIVGDTLNEHVHVILNNRNEGGNIYSLISSGGTSSLGKGKFLIRDLNSAKPSLTIDSLGNIGFRTADPSDDLQIELLHPDTTGGITVLGGNSVKDAHLILNAENNNGKSFSLAATGNGATIGTGKFAIRDINAGEERLIINGIGNIGIGDLSPSVRLHVETSDAANDGIIINGSDATNHVQLRFQNNMANGHHYNLFSTGGASAFGDGKFIIRDATTAVDRLAIGPLGNVGIGTNAPAVKLDVKTIPSIVDGVKVTGDVATENVALILENNGANGRNYEIRSTGGNSSSGEGKLVIHDATASVNRLTIDPNGKIGMGVNNPDERLHLNGAIVVDTAMTNNPGTIQFKNNEFRGYDGTSWVSLGSSGGLGSTYLEDADGDTEINVEDSPDADVIRLRLKNTLAFAFKKEIGSSARFSVLNNGNNTIISNKDDQSNTDLNNVLIGTNAGLNHTHSKQNTYIGVGTAKDADSEFDVAIGYQAMLNSNAPNFGNVAIGAQAMQSLSNVVSSESSLAIGYKAGKDADISGMFIGESAGEKNGGSFNSLIGHQAGKNLATGEFNTFVGHSAGTSLPTAVSTTIVGAFAGNGTGSLSTVIGVSAGNDGGSSPTENTLIGYNAGRFNTGEKNTMLGSRAGIVNTSGEQNTFVGQNSGKANTFGKYNTFLGADAGAVQASGDKNTFIGAFSGKTSTSGHSNTMLGYDTFMPSGLAYTNASALGAYSSLHGSHTVTIGGTGILDIGGYSSWSNLSDGRFKENVKSNVPGIEFINKLRPVTYSLNTDAIVDHLGMPEKVKNEEDNQAGLKIKAKEIQTGFIAQEVEKAAQESGYNFSGVITPQDDNNTYRLRYAEFVVPLVKAVQEQQDQIEAMQAQIDQLIRELAKK